LFSDDNLRVESVTIIPLLVQASWKWSGYKGS